MRKAMQAQFEDGELSKGKPGTGYRTYKQVIPSVRCRSSDANNTGHPNPNLTARVIHSRRITHKKVKL